VKLAVLDMGFAPASNGDFPAGLQALSNVPFVNADGTRNLSACTAGSPCPWHGTGVVNAAMAVPDNGTGGAGPAGPVAQPVVVFTLYDMFTGITAIAQAGAAGASVANMSYGAPVPAILAWSTHPFEVATTIARAAGMNLFAAAGNDATDIDATDCVGVCWEETMHTPCENLGVTCVGALGMNSTAPACYSNWGTGDSLDLWAPGTVVTGADPQSGTTAQAVSGTSVASPWAAGVAALGRAAVPGADATRVEVTLRGRARAGTGTTNMGCDGTTPLAPHAAPRIIDALAFVRDLLPAQLRITAPAPGASQRRGAPLAFSTLLYDDDRGPAAITWTLDGDPSPVAEGPSFVRTDLPYGTHTMTASATLPGGERVSDSVSFTVTNDAPQVAIQSPADGATISQSSSFALHAASVDLNEPGTGSPIPRCSGFSMTRRHPSRPATTRRPGPLPVGTHTIRLRGTDGIETAEASVRVNVTPCGANCPPSVMITSPANGTKYFANDEGYHDVAFSTTASDPEGEALTYAWRDSVRGELAQTLPTTAADPTLRLSLDGGDPCTNTPHDVTVTVTDPAGGTATDTVRC
jgi:hypothetical protein